METVDLLIEDPRWQALDLERLSSAAVTATLTHLGLDPAICELSILACDDAEISTLNADFRDKPTPTNVLSWPAQERSAARSGSRPDTPAHGPDGMIELGDIAISFDTCAAEAAAAGKPISAHVTHLMVHGVLHLLGYDHIRDADGDLMETIEVEILGKLGQDDPY
ncbi:MAG: rRNA maturation RNase YbeY [Sulfitobacter sp.]